MSASSTRRSLSPNLRARIAEKNQEIEEEIVSAQRQLSENYRAAATHEQSIIESDMVKHHAAVRRGLVRISKLVLLCYLVLGLGGIVGLWGIGLVWNWRIESGQERFDKIMADIAAQEPTLRQIEQQTWGVEYQETSEGPILLLPRGSSTYHSLGVGWVVRLPKQ